MGNYRLDGLKKRSSRFQHFRPTKISLVRIGTKFNFFLELVNPKYTLCIFNQHYVNTARRNMTASHRQRCTVPRQCGKMGAICMV